MSEWKDNYIDGQDRRGGEEGEGLERVERDKGLKRRRLSHTDSMRKYFEERFQLSHNHRLFDPLPAAALHVLRTPR